MNKCLWCKKQLKRKRNKNTYCLKSGKKRIGSKIESLKDFESRIYCDRKCQTKNISLKRTKYRTKEDVIKAFNIIRSSKMKYKFIWLRKYYYSLAYRIQKLWGKNAWSKFLTEIGCEDKIINNYYNPLYKRHLKEFIFYLKNELDILPYKQFEYGLMWGVPTSYGNLTPLQIHKCIQYGIKHGKIRRLQRGNVIDLKTRKQINQASRYVYTAIRI